jgi:ParB-like chromosome segregation protein Spo0J
MHIHLERRDVASLVPYANNVKRHAPEDVAVIAASIQRFGFNDPIGITPDGVIVEGHGRWEAAQQLGITEVPVIVLGEMSEREVNLYRIAHNKIALSTGFNLEALVANLRDLVGGDITLSVMGFDEEAASRLLGATTAPGVATPVTATAMMRPAPAEVHECIAIWDSAEDKQEFETFVQAIRESGESAADALLRKLEGALHGVVSTNEKDHVRAH